MKDNCLIKQLDEDPLFQLNNNRKNRLYLLCCDVCRKVEEHFKNVNKYEKLYIIPLMLSYRKEENSLMRAIGSSMLEHIAEEFENADTKQVNEFLSLISRVSMGEDKYSNNDLLQLSEGSYCQVIARLYWLQYYELVRSFALQYILNNSRIIGSHSRCNWYHKDEEDPFFIIGISLDEGVTESLACEMLESLSYDPLKDAYYFEMKFVDKLLKTFKFELNEFLVMSFSDNPNYLEFLREETKKIDYCDFYDLLALSDQQKWKDVFSILKKYER